MLDHVSPFHAGERRAQARAGTPDVSDWASGFIRPRMPAAHRAFFSELPFLVLAGADGQGRHWVTLVDGPEGFVGSPDPRHLEIAATPAPGDPLAGPLMAGTDVGVLGIELATRRRNRLSGRTERLPGGFGLTVRQSFGNCPQYIHKRVWRRVAGQRTQPVQHAEALDADQIARIRAADTLFIGTGQRAQEDLPSNGFDASHRGGAPGFVSVLDPTHLRIPDYAGNGFFNTIGNLLENPRIGLVFVDFDTGGLLQITGRATVDWDAAESHDPAALRMIDVTIDAVVDRPGALSLRWAKSNADLRELIVAAKVRETDEITSFYLAPTDGRPLAPFQAGQHLPIELDIPGQSAPVSRMYSLSGVSGQGPYRLSIKRDPAGLASRFLHDAVQPGDRIRAQKPAGDFVVPDETSPLVLVSAGVGFTPMLAMLHEALSKAPERPLWYVHGARDGRHVALRDEVAALAGDHPNLTAAFFLSQPAATDVAGVDYQTKGRITAAHLMDLAPAREAQFMLCGPARFLADLREGLEAAGVDAERIHFETFGPAA